MKRMLATLVLGAALATPPAWSQTGNHGDVPLAQWQPLPAATALEIAPETQAARDAILGPDATDPAYVKLWWAGVSSFIVSMGGHLFLFDAWEIVGLHADYLPIGREELAALAPEAILIGHGHFDHAGDAGYIAGRTGAAIVGSQEICDLAREQADRDGNALRFPCLVTGTATTPAPGTTQRVRLWADLPEVAILQHIHSAATEELDDPGTPFVPVAPESLLAYLLNLNTDPQEYQWFLESLDDPQGGTWAYHLRIGDFSLLQHNSAGPIRSENPGGPEVQKALDAFPDCVDVQLGAILGFNQPLNGLRDPRLYVEHVHAKVFLPTHHDNWAPGVSAGAEGYRDTLMAEINALEHPPEVDFLVDPADYLKPRIYRVDDPRWKTPMPGSSCAGPKAQSVAQRFGGALGWALVWAGLLGLLMRRPPLRGHASRCL
jgi:hypothetical protein